jgi:hypothetical protein
MEQKVILHIKDDRQGAGRQDRPELLFDDKCATHRMARVLRRLAQQSILVITSPPHTSGIFQVLYRLTFGVMKRVKRYLPKKNDLSPAADHVHRVFVAYERATVSESVRGANTVQLR